MDMTDLRGRPVELLPCPPAEEFSMETLKVQLRHGRHVVVDDAALILGVTSATLKQWISWDIIGRTLIGKRVFVPLDEVERLLALRKSDTDPTKKWKRRLKPREPDAVTVA